MTQELQPISPNKTVVFYSPLDGIDILVRTGAFFDPKDSKGSEDWKDKYLPLLHAVFCAYSSTYIKADIESKNKVISKAIKMLEPVVKKHVKRMKRSVKHDSKNPSFNTIFLENLQTQYAIQDDFHQLISELVPISVYEVIFEENNKSFSISDIETILRFLSDSLPKETGKKQKEFCMKKLQALLETTLKETEKNIVPKTSTIPVGFFLNILTKSLKRNIYILDPMNRMPKNIEFQKRSEYSKSIVLLQFPTCYETVGRLLEKNRVQREFLGDEIVDKIQAFLYDRKLKKLYPELAEYLPKTQVSESEENDLKKSDDSDKSEKSDESDESESESDKSDLSEKSDESESKKSEKSDESESESKKSEKSDESESESKKSENTTLKFGENKPERHQRRHRGRRKNRRHK